MQDWTFESLFETTAVCNVCGRQADKPRRRLEPGRGVVEGCVDAFHNEAMALDKWHNRKAAKQIRKENAEHLRKLFRKVKKGV